MWDYIFSWSLLWWILLPVYVIACTGLIVVVLLQKGKGTGFAGAFGVGGGSEAVFGPRSSRSLPQKLTYTAAGLFMVLAMVLSILSGKVGKGAAPELADDVPVAESAKMDELFQGDGAAPAADGAAAPAAEATTPVVVEEGADASAPVEVPAETPAAAVPAPESAPVEVVPAPATPDTTVAPVSPAPEAAAAPAPAEPVSVPAETAAPEAPAAQ